MGHLSQLFQGWKGFMVGLLIDFFILLGLKVFFLLLGHFSWQTQFPPSTAPNQKRASCSHQIGQVILAKMGRIYTLRALLSKLSILIRPTFKSWKRDLKPALTRVLPQRLVGTGLRMSLVRSCWSVTSWKQAWLPVLANSLWRRALKKLIVADVQNHRGRRKVNSQTLLTLWTKTFSIFPAEKAPNSRNSSGIPICSKKKLKFIWPLSLDSIVFPFYHIPSLFRRGRKK